jgi:penicillin-binding protein 2
MHCNGALQFGTRSFRCHKHSGHGSVDLFDSVVQSCDVFFYTLGQRLGVDRIHHYAHDVFGFGQYTGLELGDESAGLIPSTQWKQEYFRNPEDKRWYPGETLPVAIGQGAVTTTPLQVARALAAFVNGGNLVKPRIVKQLVASDGRVIQQASDQPEDVRKINLKPWVFEQVKRAMVGVVEDKRGTGHRAALPKESGVIVGGKTGTAQVASRESGSKREDHAWFAGYAPADKPQIVAVAILENAGHGGAIAAPIVRDVMAAYFGVTDVKVATVRDDTSVVDD